jgi:hypothetical protein
MLGVVVLAALLIAGTMLAVGCGGGAAGSADKAKLTAALSDFELSAGAVTQALAAGSDAAVAAGIKAAKPNMKVKWEAVLAAAKGMKWPNQEAGQEAWANVEHAIDSLAGNATLATATAALTPAMDALMSVEAELWNLVQTTE